MVSESQSPWADFYYSLEDKWYSIVDAVDQVIPVKGIVEKIDKIFPSFVLFIIVILALLLSIGIGLFFLFSPQGLAGFKVVDIENTPLSNISVIIHEGENVKTFVSDGFGEFFAPLNSKTVKVTVSEEGFKPFDAEITVESGTNLIVLEKVSLQLEKKLVKIVDEKNIVLKQSSTVTFSCNGDVSPPQSMTVTSGEEFEVVFSKECTSLTAQVLSSGFNDATKVLSDYSNTIKLEPLSTPKGEIIVQVRDSQTNALLPNIDLVLFKAAVFPVKANEARTDASGSNTFNAALGNYFVRATDSVLQKYSSNQSEEFDLRADQTKTIEVLLSKNSSTKNKLLFRFIDESTGQSIENVNADLLEENLLSSGAKSDSGGTALFRNLDEQKKYAVVITHPQYVTRVLESLALLDEDSQSPMEVKLIKATSNNSGTIRVTVSSVEQEGNVGIGLADVALFSPDYNFSILSGKTDGEGKIVFKNMQPGDFFAKADSLSHSGTSRTGTLFAGTELVLSVNFVVKQSFVKVKTVDALGNIVTGVNLKFFGPIGNELLLENSTGTSGETEKIGFEWTQKFYITAEKNGFLTYNTKIFSLAPDNTTETIIVMRSVQENTEFTIELLDVMDSSKEKSAQKIERGKKYFLKFGLIVPQENLSAIQSVVRTGFEENHGVEDNNFFITGVVKGSNAMQAVFSKCYDPLNDFNDCSVTDSNSKQVILKSDSLQKGVHEFLVEVFVSPKTEANAKLELRFGAKARQGETEFRKPQTGLFFKEFVLNNPVFCVRGTANCPNIGFFFTLTDPTAKHLPEPLELNSTDTFELIQGIEYLLDYVIWNWDRDGKSFNNPQLSFADELATGAVEITPEQISLGLIEPDTSFQGTPVKIIPRTEAAAVQVKAVLDVLRPDNSALLKFRVLARNNLETEVAPEQIIAGALNTVTVKVNDSQTHQPVLNALVKASTFADFSDALTSTSVSSENGVYVLNLPSMQAGQSVFVRAEAFNYNASNTTEITVSSLLSFNPAEENEFGCIEIGQAEISVPHKEDSTVQIRTNSCNKPVEFYLYQPPIGDPLTIQNEDDLSIITNSVSPNLVLQENDSVDLIVHADRFLGEYALIVRAKFEGQAEFKDVGRVKIIVLPKSVQEGYCFSIDKTSFSVKPEDAGKISNNCAVSVTDPFLPSIVLDSDNALLNEEQLKIFPQQIFSWSAAITGTLSDSLDQPRTITSRVDAPTSTLGGGQVLQIDLGAVLVQSIPLYCGALFAFGARDCLSASLNNLGVAAIAMYFIVSSQMTSLLGNENVNLTCEQCLFSDQNQFRLVTGTTIHSAFITNVTFDDGGWLKINGVPLEIDGMGKPPASEYPEVNLEQIQGALNASATGHVLLQTTSTPAAGGFNPLQFLGGAMGPLNQILGLLSQLFPQARAPGLIEPDSCTGYLIESTNCRSLGLSSGFEENPFAGVFVGSICSDIAAPIDVKDRVNAGVVNNYELFVCNKYNDGFAEVSFEIKDEVNAVTNESDETLLPLRNEVKDAGSVSELMGFYLGSGFPNAFLKLDVTNDSEEKIATWLDETGVKAQFISDELENGSEINFQLKNLSLKGEEFGLITVEDYVSNTQPALLDIVFLLDDSISMNFEKSVFCRKKDLIENEILSKGINVVSTVYTIGAGDTEVNCADDVAFWGDTETAPTEIEINQNKAWGPALEDVISKHSFREDTKKVAVIVSDTGVIGTVEEPVGDDEEANGKKLEILQRATQMALDENISVSAYLGIPFQPVTEISSLRQIVDDTNGFLMAIEEAGEETFFANQLIKSAFEIRTETFHVRLEGSSTGLCTGANDQAGVTGPDALPRIKLEWEWSAINENTCDLGNPDFVYCDATQLTKEIVKRLVKVREKTLDNDFAVADLLTFKAFLIRDSYSPEFTAAFNDFVLSKEEFPLEEYVTDWSKFVSDNSKFSFKSANNSVNPIPSTGIYLVNIVFNSNPQEPWAFFDGNNAIGSIDVFLNLDQAVQQSNPFYFLPIDAGLGLNDAGDLLTRNGFGVAFTGDEIFVSRQSELVQQISSLPTTGSGVVLLDTGFENSFSSLNKGPQRGMLLNVDKTAGGYEMVFSPSIATPVLMEIVSDGSRAHGLFELKKGDSIVPANDYYSLWTGAASSIGSCSGFDGQNLPVKEPDSSAFGATCSFNQGATESNSRGFLWDNAQIGKVFLKTIFYTPDTEYRIRNACNTGTKIISPLTTSEEGFIGLDFGSDERILSLKDLFDMVRNEKVCVSEQGDSVDFWWNESYLEEELNKNAQNYFATISGENNNFRVCSSE